MSQEATTIDKALTELGGFMQKSPVDVALKLLETPSLYHSEIVNVPVMNALKLEAKFCKNNEFPESGQVYEDLYNLILDHMVAHKRKRAIEIKDMFASVMALFKNDQEEKKGLFKR